MVRPTRRYTTAYISGNAVTNCILLSTEHAITITSVCFVIQQLTNSKAKTKTGLSFRGRKLLSEVTSNVLKAIGRSTGSYEFTTYNCIVSYEVMLYAYTTECCKQVSHCLNFFNHNSTNN